MLAAAVSFLSHSLPYNTTSQQAILPISILEDNILRNDVVINITLDDNDAVTRYDPYRMTQLVIIDNEGIIMFMLLFLKFVRLDISVEFSVSSVVVNEGDVLKCCVAITSPSIIERNIGIDIVVTPITANYGTCELYHHVCLFVLFINLFCLEPPA